MNRFYFFIAALLAFAATPVWAQTLTTDRDDYSPGETVYFNGDGFSPGESVRLVALGSSGVVVLEVQAMADDFGAFNGSLPLPDAFEHAYEFTATGTASGIVARTTFLDAFNGSVIKVTTPTPAVACGASIPLTARALTNSGNPAGNVPFRWERDDSGVMTPPAGTSSNTNNAAKGNVSSTTIAPSGNGQTFTVTASVDDNTNGSGPFSVFWSLTTTCSSAQVITFPQPGNKTFGDPSFGVSATGGASGNPVSFLGSGQCDVSDNGNSTATVSLTGAGICSITASQEGGNGFNAATPVTRSFSIGKAAQTITFPQPPNTTFGAGEITLTATGGGSTSPVTFAYVSGPCSVAGDQATLTGAGTCVVRAAQAGDADYNAASNVDRSFDIAKADAVVSVTGYTGQYDGLAHGASGSATGVLGEDLTSLLSLGDSFTNVPGGTASWSFAGNANYNSASGVVPITITKATATVDVTGGTFTYDGLAHAASATTTPFGLAMGLDYNGAVTAPVDAGAYTVTATVNDPNYEGTGVGTIVIEKADQTITWAEPGPITYGTALSGIQLDASVVGVAGGSAPGTLTYSPAAGAILGAGLQTLRVDAAETTNYNAASKEVTLTVDKADATINVNGYTGTYDAAAHGASGTATGATGENLSSLLNFGEMFTDVPGGTANWSFPGDANHNPASGTAAIVITKATAMVNVSGYTGVYDGLAHGASGTATGIGGVDLSAGLSLGDSFENVPGGTANWTFNGGTNYNDASGAVQITISKANQTVTWTSPGSVIFGTQLPSAGLFATAAGVPGGSAAGGITYVPVAGTLLPVGSQLLVVTAAETGNYNPASAQTIVGVTYGPLGGFTSPMPGVVVRAKQGRTIPIKFVLPAPNASYGGAIARISLVRGAGPGAGEAVDAEGTGNASTGELFRWTGTEYIFNLSTRGLAVGQYTVIATLDDGQIITGGIQIDR